MSGFTTKILATTITFALTTPALAFDLGGGAGIGGSSIGGGISIGGGGASASVGASTGDGGISGGGSASIGGGGVSSGASASLGGTGVSGGGSTTGNGDGLGNDEATAGLGSGGSDAVGEVLSRNRVTVQPSNSGAAPIAASMMGRAVMSSDNILLGHVAATRMLPGNTCPTLGLSPNPALSLPRNRVWLTMGSCRSSKSSHGALRIGTSSQAFLRAVY